MVQLDLTYLSIYFVINNLLKSYWIIYADDVTSGTKTIEQGKEFYKKTKLTLSKANYNLRKWVTNDSKFQVFLGQLKRLGA